MFIDYSKVAKLAEKKGASTRKLFVALSHLARMENAEATVASVMSGAWSIAGDGVSLDDKSDPNRSEFDYLYSRA